MRRSLPARLVSALANVISVTRKVHYEKTSAIAARTMRAWDCDVFAARQENDCPQPQLRSAFGLLMENPAPWSPSL
jgi:hypothetical protein